MPDDYEDDDDCTEGSILQDFFTDTTEVFMTTESQALPEPHALFNILTQETLCHTVPRIIQPSSRNTFWDLVKVRVQE